MQTNNVKKTKKREGVIPFSGEENFVVPKRGGFGQIDNENYFMIAGGSDNVVKGVSDSIPTGIVDTPPIIALDNPILIPTKLPPIDIDYSPPLIPIKPDLPPNLDLPTFPVFSSLSCIELEAFIKETELLLSTSKFSNVAIGEAYNNAVQVAKGLFTTKCPIVTVTSGGGMGSGGGGLDTSGSGLDSGGISEKGKRKNYYLLILAVIAGIFLLTRKKSG
jgi:hypothetical protein